MEFSRERFYLFIIIVHMQIQPLSDRVVLRYIESDRVTKSGLYLPETANKERPYVYEVVAVGPGKEVDGKTRSIDLKVGDRVISGQYSGDEIEIEESGKKVKYKIVGFDYILGKIID